MRLYFKMSKYDSEKQRMNLGWILPRPNPDRFNGGYYNGGMPLFCEDWLINLAKDILKNDCPTLLNVFCGMNKYGVRVDLNPKVRPDYLYDVHNISEVIKEKFDIILADPPYSNEESKEMYGTPPLNYKKWTGECDKLLNDDGLLIVYHKHLMPNPNFHVYEVVKRVFVAGRVNHPPRVAVYFQKTFKDKRTKLF